MNEHHRTLLDDLDEAPVGAAPVGHLLTGGQAVKRRRQRAFVAGAAAVTALVVGGSALALQGIPGGSDDRDSNDPLIADSAAPDLAVEVEVGVTKPLAALIDGHDGKVAIWNPGHRTLAFVPERGYSSGCPPLGTAEFTDSGAVTLTVRNDPAPDPCTADDQPITVTIDGLTTAPPELTVTVSGETDTIPVKFLPEGQAPDASGPSEPDGPSPSARRVTLRLAATSGWPVFRPTDCGQWSPSSQDSVVALNTLADDCITKASRNATTVFLASYGNPPFSERWADVTVQWRRVDGADVRRLSSGSLVEMSSRVVDAIACEACDQVIVVVGPHPGTVRSLLESVGTG